MQYKWDKSVAADERVVVRRALDRFPDNYRARVMRNPAALYTVWIVRGGFDCLVHLWPINGERVTDADIQNLVDEVMRGLRAMEHRMEQFPTRARENEGEYTQQDYIKQRLGDFERTMSPTQIEQFMEEGRLKGLEFMREKQRAKLY